MFSSVGLKRPYTQVHHVGVPSPHSKYFQQTFKTQKSRQNVLRLPRFPSNFDNVIDDFANQKARKLSVLISFIADNLSCMLYVGDVKFQFIKRSVVALVSNCHFAPVC